MEETNPKATALAIAEVVKFYNNIRVPCVDDMCNCIYELYNFCDYFDRQYKKLKEKLGVKVVGHTLASSCVSSWQLLATYTVADLYVGGVKVASLVERVVQENGAVVFKVDIKEVHDERVKEELCKIMPSLTVCQKQ